MYNGDPPIPLHRLIKVVEPYMDENILGRRIKQSREALSMATKMLGKMRENKKRYYQNRRSTLIFYILKKHNVDKVELKWEPNYRNVKLLSAWSAVFEDHLSGKSKRYNIGDIKPKHPWEDWEKSSSIRRAAKFVSHPDNLPEVDFSVDKPSNQQIGTEPIYNLRRPVKAPTKVDW